MTARSLRKCLESPSDRVRAFSLARPGGDSFGWESRFQDVQQEGTLQFAYDCLTTRAVEAEIFQQPFASIGDVAWFLQVDLDAAAFSSWKEAGGRVIECGLERCRREVLVSLHFNHFHIDLVNLLHLVTSSHLLDTFA